MDIFKGKIEAKCIDVQELGATYASLQSLGVSGIAQFYQGVTFYAPIEVDTLNVNNLSVTTANLQNIGVSSIDVGLISVTSISVQNLTVENQTVFTGGVTFQDDIYVQGCIHSDCIIADTVTIGSLGVTGPAQFTGPSDFFGNVTFHSNIFGISGGAGDTTINGVSGFTLGVDGDVHISGDLIIDGGVTIYGPLNAKIGNPTDDSSSRPIDISTTYFTNDIGLNLNANMNISDGFQIIDAFFKTYFLYPPPGVSLIGCTSTTANITVQWQNFAKVEYAPLNIFLPHVIENRIDYVQSSLNGSLDWSHPSTITINTTSRDTDTVVFHTQGSGSGLSSTTWNQYTILPNVEYDIRIYGVNNHSGTPTYLKLFNKSTSAIGVPIAPTALTASGASTTTISSSWTKPIDHDNVTVGNNTFPIIERYGVDFQAIGSVRYPTYLTHTGTQFTSLTTDPTNSSTSLTLTGLNPGTTYTLSVAAKNSLNGISGPNSDGYGAESTTVNTSTNLPSKPPLLSITDANSLNNLSTLRSPYLSNGGYSLDGVTTISPIIRFANINDTSQPLRTTETPSVRNNETPGITSLNTATLTAYGGLDTQYQISDLISENIDGFSFATNVGNYNGTKVRLRINSDGDFYGSPSSGFYKYYTMYAQGLVSALYYPASIDKYVLGLKYQSLDGGSTITTNKVNFYVDDLNVNPSVTGVYISEETIGISASTQISGVPTYRNNANFRFQFTMNEMANYFLRHDRKHAEAVIETSGNVALSNTLTIQKISNTPSSGNVDGTTHQYFNAPTNLHQRSTNLHNTLGQVLSTNSGNIQLHTFSITLSSAANSKFDENFRIDVTPYNLYTANSSGTSLTGIYANPGITSLTQSKLRIDTKSIENDRSGSATTTSQGRHVKSGLGTYPELGTTSGYAGDTYNHSESILSGDYAQELQLVNGSYQTPSVGDGYKNYNQSAPNNYYFPTAYTFYDYSTISSGVTTVRYTTFKYTGVIPSGQTRERLRITINNVSGLTVDFTQFNQANHQLWLRVVDIGDGSVLEDTTTQWLDCTNTIGQSGLLYGTNGTACVNGGTSSASIRDCYIKPGSTENATIYIRIGLAQNLNAQFTSITCTSVTTF